MVAAGVSGAGADNYPALLFKAECEKEKILCHYVVARGLPHDRGDQTLGKAA